MWNILRFVDKLTLNSIAGFNLYSEAAQGV